jgi:hypothetical protein
MQRKMHDEFTDKIHGIIVERIIETSNKPTTLDRRMEASDLFNINNMQFSDTLLKKIEEFEKFKRLFINVPHDKYVANILLHLNSNRMVPLFVSKNTFRIKRFIEETKNQFISKEIREEYTQLYCKFKRVYWGFTKLARIWKIRRTPIRIQTDLYMNELDPSHKHTYHLIHKNGIYLFSLQNLARIIVDSITHQSGMFVEPLTIKNPYTNDLLSKCDLINIYLSFRHNNIRINEMFEKFFRCEFNIFEFHRKHETELRDIAIEQYAKTTADVDLVQDVEDMLRIHKLTKKMNISPGFPQKQLVRAMRPFLKIFLLERYSFSSMTRKYSAKKLDFELRRFIENNPLFGRRIATAATTTITNNPFLSTQNKVAKTEMKYITETTQYPRYCISNYMNTHIYDEDIFYRYVDTGDSDETYSKPIDDYEEPHNQQQDGEEEEEYDENEDTNGIQTRTVISTFVFSTQQQQLTQETERGPNENTNTIVRVEDLSSHVNVTPLVTSQQEITRTPQQIRESALTILTRIGRNRSLFERERQSLLTNNSEEEDADEDENEEVIENMESESEDNIEDDEDADSVS